MRTTTSTIMTAVLAVTLVATASAAPQADPKPAAATADKKDAAPAGQAKAAKPAPAKPEPTGLERLSSDWPTWLKMSMLYRGRVESVRPVTGSVTDYDTYYLNRLRLSATIQAGKWVQVVGQIHDTETMGYTTGALPTSMTAGFDLRQGYVEIGKKQPRGVIVSGGRMELTEGDGRLIASPDWGNSSRTYDMGKVSAFVPGFRIDAFRAAPVLIDTVKFDRVKPGEYFWGAYATVDKVGTVKRVSLVDVYWVLKANSVLTGELGSKGDGRLYTYGARAVGSFSKTVTWDVDGAIQRGHQSADDVSAYMVHAAVGWVMSKSTTKPKLTVEYDYASGDKNAKDGKRGTFDQLYASNHAKYGFADLVGLRNVQLLEAKFEVTPTKKVKVNAAIAHLALANVADSWYNQSGSKVVLNAKATSRSLGWEPDLYATYTVSKEMALSAGIALLAPGGFVEQSLPRLDRYWYPYAMCTLKF